MLSLQHVSVRYDDLLAVEDVSLALPDGEVLAVLGPSGCGKSTLLRAIAGLEPVSAGSVAFDGEDLAGTPPHRRGFALMFQDGQLFGHLSVAGNVGYPLRLRRTAKPRIRARVDELLELVGLAGYGERLPRTLSGGERQRVALARALAVEPRLLLLDEPLSALDAELRRRLAGELREILHTAGTTALMVTHDQDEAWAVADRIAVMRGGRLVQEGPVADVWAGPADAETALFLGYARVLDGAAAACVLELAGAGAGAGVGAGFGAHPRVAVRRSAFVVDESGPLEGTVVSLHATPEQARLMVDAAGIGVVDAVAATGARGVAAPVPGASVRLRLDPARVAVIDGLG
ncbi:ABC transporter ATP-binding protein [Nocardioides pacificus]